MYYAHHGMGFCNQGGLGTTLGIRRILTTISPGLSMHFDLDKDLYYFNHAAVAPWPVATAEAVARFAEQNARIGAEKYPDWVVVESRVRKRLAELIGASSADDIAFVKNTSEGLSLVAYGLDWRPGDEIVCIASDFPSNRLVWESLASQGVRTIPVDVLGSDDPESALIAALTPSTRLLAVSSVHYGSGRRLDLEFLGEACRAAGLLFCIDAIQSVGAIPFDVQTCHADFVAADSHKWLLGPEGIGFLYCAPQRRESLRLLQFGWHMVEAMGDYQAASWEPAHGSRRFEPGSPNMLGLHALDASLDVIATLGVEHIFSQIVSLNGYLIEKAADLGLPQRYPHPLFEAGSGMVTLDIGIADPVDVWKYLLEKRVVTAPRGGGIRFSPHVHNTRQQIDHALSVLIRALTS